ncbi:hypothetical protein [Roseococcus suduntuyensis]|uniref:Uncharacterized protein n=1 Tax=Roseococcus suduntuyensis TaxID=455361 RepID=A0A840A9F7_9PROT|nr:hypothetical protein [Roseococcus suduntuyensis]MBB3897146.1 hypothetical protein [Roseococcus suduntuyensis]
MTGDATAEEVREARMRLTRHLTELHKLHLTLLAETRALKRFTTAGRSNAEIEITAEVLEQYLSATDAFLENMRGRVEARLGMLRRGEPLVNGRADDAPGHGAFWLSFSRLCAVLRRAAKRAEA